MASDELQRNLPNLIAVGILLFALLIVSTKAGLVRCSSLGDSYCDVYYTIMGKPNVLILTDGSGTGMGDTRALARLVQDQYGVPVSTLSIDKLSAGMLSSYSVVIVEHARTIPTEKLKLMKDYVFADHGRLVWVGNAGTLGSTEDQVCKTLKYSGQYSQEGNTYPIESKEKRLCVQIQDPAEGESVSQAMTDASNALVEQAMAELETQCQSLGGSLDWSTTDKGYQCKDATYEGVYLRWDDEEEYKTLANPWNRGEYKKLGKEETEPGINFGEDVLGVSFIADDYAVQEYEEYHAAVNTVKKSLLEAHAAFAKCSAAKQSAGCDPTGKLQRVKTDLKSIDDVKNDADTALNGYISTLRSTATQKQNAGDENAILFTDTANKLEDNQQALQGVDVPEDAPETITALEAISEGIASAKNAVTTLKASEEEDAVKNQLATMETKLESLAARAQQRLTALENDLAAYKACAQEETGTLAGDIAKETQHEEELKVLMSYASPLADDDSIIRFMGVVNSDTDAWEDLAEKLGALDTAEVCGQEIDGFAGASDAISASIAAAGRTDPAAASQALATMQAADSEHPLVTGISDSIALKKNGLPVPFVLVDTTTRHSHTVTQLLVTPAYRNKQLWPAITVKDPKFATHQFGTGTVVFYAFPPETDEIFIRNLMEFILY